MLNVNDFENFEVETDAGENHVIFYMTTKNNNLAEQYFEKFGRKDWKTIAKDLDVDPFTIDGVEISLEIEKATGAVAVFTYGVVEDEGAFRTTHDTTDIQGWEDDDVLGMLTACNADEDLVSLVKYWLNGCYVNS